MKRYGFLLIAFVLLISLINFVDAQTTGFYGGVGSSSFVNQQLYRPSFQTYYGEDNRLGTYWPILNDQSTCKADRILYFKLLREDASQQ